MKSNDELNPHQLDMTRPPEDMILRNYENPNSKPPIKIKEIIQKTEKTNTNTKTIEKNSNTGGCFAGAVGAVNMLALFTGLEHETKGGKTARQDLNFLMFLALSITMANGYLSEEWEWFSGSFGQFWLAFAAPLALGYLAIIQSEWDDIRGLMSKALFHSKYDHKIDLLNGFLFVSYGVMLFFSTSLHLGFLQGFMPQFMAVFGLLEPVPESFGYGTEIFLCGCWALAMAGLNLSAFCGIHENSDYRKVRRYASIVFWCNFVVCWSKYPENGSFFTFWTFISLSMAMALVSVSKNDAPEIAGSKKNV